MSAAYEIVTTKTGAISIRDNKTNEIMHNPVGPWVEANSLYIEQSQLARHLTATSTESLPAASQEALVLFDVGLGAAANALSVLHCARGLTTHRPLRMISFERDLTLLQFALDHADQFEHFHGYEPAVQAILDKGRWEEEGIHWELRHGDFLERIGRESTLAHLVYYDPYSFKKNSAMWTAEIFRKVHSKCSTSEGAQLFTYSCATPIRIAMLMGGFFVGTGISSGPKEETTQASTRLEDLPNPLGAQWLERWKKSHSPNSAGASEDVLPKVKEFILNHVQFKI